MRTEDTFQLQAEQKDKSGLVQTTSRVSPGISAYVAHLLLGSTNVRFPITFHSSHFTIVLGPRHRHRPSIFFQLFLLKELHLLVFV
jgi:hypothetical protein